MEEEAAKLVLGKVFGFAYVWALGGNLSQTCREEFDDFVREHLQQVISFPGGGVVFDYQLNLKSQPLQLKPWADSVPAFTYDKAVPYFQV